MRRSCVGCAGATVVLATGLWLGVPLLKTVKATSPSGKFVARLSCRLDGSCGLELSHVATGQTFQLLDFGEWWVPELDPDCSKWGHQLVWDQDEQGFIWAYTGTPSGGPPAERIARVFAIQRTAPFAREVAPRDARWALRILRDLPIEEGVEDPYQGYYPE